MAESHLHRELEAARRDRVRLELLQQMTAALSRAYTVGDVARTLVDEGIAKLGMPRGGVWRTTSDGEWLEILHDRGYSPRIRAAMSRLPVGSPLPIARVLATHEIIWVSSRADYERRYEAGNAESYPVRDSEETSFFCAPLLVEGRAVGCVSFNDDRAHDFPEEERRFIEALVEQCALALHRALLLASESDARAAAEREQLRFRAIFEQTKDGIMLSDPDLRIVDCNPAACAILQRPREAIVGHDGREFVPTEEHAGLATRVEELRRGAATPTTERWVLLPDGTARLLEVAVTPHALPGLHLTTFRDVHDRKRAEESVRFLEEASRMFASSLDPEETLATIARLAVPRLADWAAVDVVDGDEIRRVTVMHVDPAKIALSHRMRAHRPQKIDGEGGVPQVIRSGQPTLVPRITEEMLEKALADDPDYLAMVRSAGLVSLMTIPFFAHEECRGAITFAFSESRRRFDERDVRFAEELARRAGAAFERALAYDELREANRAMDLVLQRTRNLQQLTAALASTMTIDRVAATLQQHAPRVVGSDAASLWILDGDGALVRASQQPDDARFMNRIALDGSYPLARAVRSRTPMFLSSPEELLALAPDLTENALRGKAWAQVPLVAAAGNALGALAFRFATPTAFDDDARQLLVAVAEQCAVALDRARAYEAEAIALRKKDEFMAMLGHELRNPLAPIVTVTSLIRLRGTVTERELDVLERQGRHLVRLVDDLLDVSRIATGKLELRREPLDVADVVAQSIEIASNPFEDKRVRVKVDVPPGVLRVDGDRERLVQVVTNVLVNAAKFTPAGRAVFVSARADSDAAVIEVRDEGEGIAPEVLPGIFGLFAQGPQASDRRDGGLGLGLAIARSIVEVHDGSIEASSPGRDRGTTLTIRLPLLQSADAPADRASATDSIASPSTPRRRVLIVDDNNDAAEMMATLLEGLGYEASIAGDGPQALARLEQSPPDAAILDIGLPGMDGYELATEIRRRLGARAPALIALTGYAQASDRERAFANGFRAHFAKPVDVEKLVATVKEILPIA